MTDPIDTGNEGRWRSYLSGEDPAPRARRALWRRLPVAAASDLLCSEASYAAPGLEHPGERREVALKGVSNPVAVRVLRANYFG
jgi:hypothetical protein